MKITKQRMRELIKEELSYLQKEENIDEAFKDYALAGGVALGSLFGGAAQAGEPAQKPATTQVVKQEVKTAREGIAQISDKVMEMKNIFADDSVGPGARSFNLGLEKSFAQLNHVASLVKNPKDKDFILKITANIKPDLAKLIGLQKNNKNLKELLQLVETVETLASSGKI